MSVDWGVLPLLPDDASQREWLQHAGYESIPAQTGRYPTLDELTRILDAMPLTAKNISGDTWEISIGELHSDNYAYILGSVQADGRFHFHFLGSDCQEITMLDILKRLASVCGALILYESTEATPVLITAATEITDALTDWQQRIHENLFAEDEED